MKGKWAMVVCMNLPYFCIELFCGGQCNYIIVEYSKNSNKIWVYSRSIIETYLNSTSAMEFLLALRIEVIREELNHKVQKVKS